MRAVIERHGYTIDEDGWIHYQETPSTYEAAEKLAGFKLDRRKNYALMDGKVHESCCWASECSGCDGYGCHECGSRGVRRSGAWVPVPGQGALE